MLRTGRMCLAAALFVSLAAPVSAQGRAYLSIGTGSTSDVCSPMRDGIAGIIATSLRGCAAKPPVRTLHVLYPSSLQVVPLERADIGKAADSKRKRVAISAPGSATEALRLLETQQGLDRDIRWERLSV
jgi:TRAP-type uncharacterized transport system substrate-binding protein